MPECLSFYHRDGLKTKPSIGQPKPNVKNKENICIYGRDEERRAEKWTEEHTQHRRFGRDDERREEIGRGELMPEHRRMALPQPLVYK